MVVYRQKNPNRQGALNPKPDEVIGPEHLKPGLVGWAQIDGVAERQQHVCDANLEWVPFETYQARNKERSDKNRGENQARYLANVNAGKHDEKRDTSHLRPRRDRDRSSHSYMS